MSSSHRAHRRPLPILLVLLAALPSLAIPVTAELREPERVPIDRATTSIGFFHELLAALDVEVELDGASTMTHHPLSVSGDEDAAFVAAGGGLDALFTDGVPAGWKGGERVVDAGLRHRGGFVLRRGDRVLGLRDFVLHPVGHPYALGLATADGRRVLEVRAPIALRGGMEPGDSGDPAVLHLLNGDLTLTRTGADALGLERPLILGTVEVVQHLAAVPEPSIPRLVFDEKGAPPPCGDWSGDVDVALEMIKNVQQMGGVRDGKIVVAGDAYLRNVGTANVPWYRKFSGSFPPYGNDQHPYLVWAMYRLRADGVFEQMARSELKHAFATANIDCDPGACGPVNGHILGLGCVDWYSASTNVNNLALASRAEVDPRTGVWTHCDEPAPGTPSHFDADGDCTQDFFGAGEDVFTHGMAVSTAELGAGDRYFFESWYVVRGDIDIYDSMAYVEVTPTLSNGVWHFPIVGDHHYGPAVDAWVDPSAPPAGAMNVKESTADGAVQLAVVTTDLGGGFYRYVYALHNHEVAAGLTAFEVPLPPGATAVAATMVDTDDEPANDWSADVGPAGVRWSAPDGNPLPWGGLFTFAVEVDAAPAAGTAGISLSTAHPVATLTPAGAATLGWIFVDGFESGDVDAWSAASAAP